MCACGVPSRVQQIHGFMALASSISSNHQRPKAPDAARLASLTCGQRGQSQTSHHRPRRCARAWHFSASRPLSVQVPFHSTPESDGPLSPLLFLSRSSTRERSSRDAVRPLQRPISHRRTAYAYEEHMHLLLLRRTHPHACIASRPATSSFKRGTPAHRPYCLLDRPCSCAATSSQASLRRSPSHGQPSPQAVRES